MASSEAESESRVALARANERLGARLEAVQRAERVARLFALATDTAVDWIGISDPDSTLRADAFGSLRRSFDAGPAMVGGRGLLDDQQHFGAMFASPRSGPHPFELITIWGPASDNAFAELVRGSVDMPQRGMFFVSAAFVRSIAPEGIDDDLLHLDLAVRARAAGAIVACEPALTFRIQRDAPILRRKVGDLSRYGSVGAWPAGHLHRQPAGLRAAYVYREVRAMGDVRGHERRPVPPIDVMVVGADEMIRRRGIRDARALLAGGRVFGVAPSDGDALRRELGSTSDRYLLVTDALDVPNRGLLESLCERLEATSRHAVALDRNGRGAVALYHLGRITNGHAFAGATVDDVLQTAVERLPSDRLFVVDPGGPIVPDVMKPLPPLGAIDLIFVAASRPEVTSQTLGAISKERFEGTITAVYPAGARTTARLLQTHVGIRAIADDSDPHLGIALNRALAESTARGVLIVRDDAQLPVGCIPHLCDVFRRIPRLGIAVPRVGGSGRPEALPDVGYFNSGDMQGFSDRRASQFAREATLVNIVTAPVLLTTRSVLDVVGGFDERFAFSRVGVEDFARRVLAANFRIARCDDAYAHLFSPFEAMSFLSSIDDDAGLRAVLDERWAKIRGFPVEATRVPLRANSTPAGAAEPPTAVRVLLPVATDAEWIAVRSFLMDVAAEFRASDPIRVLVLLDGAFSLQPAVSGVRDILAAVPIPLEQTIHIAIELNADLTSFRDGVGRAVRFGPNVRTALADLPAVAGSVNLRALLTETYA